MTGPILEDEKRNVQSFPGDGGACKSQSHVGAQLDSTQETTATSHSAELADTKLSSMDSDALSPHVSPVNDLGLSTGSVRLREACLTPDWDAIGYKLVAKRDDHYFSFWAGDSFEYELGVTTHEEALAQKRGGLYVCQTRWCAKHQKVIASADSIRLAPKAMLLCACQGPFVEYYAGKAACSSLTPLGEVPIPHKDDFPAGRNGQWNHLAGLNGGRSMDGTNRVRTLDDWDFIGYLTVAKRGCSYMSLSGTNGEPVHFEIGSKIDQSDIVQDESRKTGGLSLSLIVSPTPLAAVRNDFMVHRSGFEQGRLALLWCACEGPVFEICDSPQGKLVCSKLTPLGEVNVSEAFLKEIPLKEVKGPQSSVGVLLNADRTKARKQRKSSGISQCSTTPMLRRGQSKQVVKASTADIKAARATSRSPRPPSRQPCEQRKSRMQNKAKEVTCEKNPIPPERPRSAPAYKPSSRLRNVLSRWGTPMSEGGDGVMTGGESSRVPTRPAAPRPAQGRQGLWVGRSVELSGCL